MDRGVYGECKEMVSELFYSSIIHAMLYTIAIVLGILWLLGVVTSNVLGGFIHILLVIAIIVVLIRVIRGENIV